jgi:AcrR family transcriptional regulator
MSSRAAERDSRHALLNACAKTLANYGYRKLTVDDVARSAGVTRRTVYTYFPDREHLIRAVVEDVFAQSRAAMRKALDGHSTPIEKLHDVLLARVATRLEVSWDYLDGVQEALDHEFMQGTMSPAEFYKPDHELVAEALRLAAAHHNIPALPFSDIAEVLIRSTDAFLVLHPDERRDFPGVRRRLAVAVHLLIRGLEFTNADEVK